jgi:hypothetical protein
MIDYALILSTHYVGKKWLLNGDSYDGLDWLDSSQKPTKSELDALWTSTKAQADQAEETKITAKASALAKLAALGLTQDEVKALVG